MSDTKHLFSREAVERIQKIAGDARTGFFCCNLTSRPFDATPMATQQVEDDGTIWFFSAKDSDRNQHLAQDSNTQLIYAVPGDAEYLSLYGQTEIMYDLAKVEELWSPMSKVWFQGGPTDPNLSLLRFTPQEGYYWDTKNGKTVAFAKMAASLVVGKTMDDGVSGELRV